MSTFPYRGYAGGYSYGLQYHFRVERQTWGAWVVFNVVDGAIWGRCTNPPSLRWDAAELEAQNLCHEFNGRPFIDTSGMDDTP